MADPLIALTLWPEWAWTIVSGQSWPEGLVRKMCENRTWHPGKRLAPGSRLAIHAGKSLGGKLRASETLTREALGGLLSMFKRANPEHFRPYSLWTADVRDCPKSAIVAVVTIDGFDRDDRTGWDVPGAWHWRFRSVSVLREPVPITGKQGLWKVPEYFAAQVREREVPHVA